MDEQNKVKTLEELAAIVNKQLLNITNENWQSYSRPAMLTADEKRERAAAVRLAHRQSKNQFIKMLRAQKLDGII